MALEVPLLNHTGIAESNHMSMWCNESPAKYLHSQYFIFGFKILEI